MEHGPPTLHSFTVLCGLQYLKMNLYLYYTTTYSCIYTIYTCSRSSSQAGAPKVLLTCFHVWCCVYCVCVILVCDGEGGDSFLSFLSIYRAGTHTTQYMYMYIQYFHVYARIVVYRVCSEELTFLWWTIFMRRSSRKALLAYVSFWNGLTSFLMATVSPVLLSSAELRGGSEAERGRETPL